MIATGPLIRRRIAMAMIAFFVLYLVLAARLFDLQVLQAEDPTALLLPVDACFAGRPLLLLTSHKAEKQVRNGAAVTLPAPPADGTYRVYGRDREFLALSRVQNGVLTTIKSCFEV